MDSQDLPSLADQIRSLYKTTKQIQQSSQPLIAKKPLWEQRRNVCDSCPFYQISTDRCTQCGCIMRVKVRLNAASCPIHKW